MDLLAHISQGLRFKMYGKPQEKIPLRKIHFFVISPRYCILYSYISKKIGNIIYH
jgi:hypothetical protein